MQAAQAAFEVSGAVPKEQVFPLFESAGHMFHALKGELPQLGKTTHCHTQACPSLYPSCSLCKGLFASASGAVDNCLSLADFERAS